MSVLLETTKGNIVIDLDYQNSRIESFNFIKLAKLGHYFFCPFFDLKKNDVIVSGIADYPSNLYNVGMAITGIADVTEFDKTLEKGPTIARGNHNICTKDNDTVIGKVYFVTDADQRYGSAFKIILGDNNTERSSEEEKDAYIGAVAEGFGALDEINKSKAPVYLLHAHVLYDPFPDSEGLLQHKIDTERPTREQIDNFAKLQENVDHDASETEGGDALIQALALELVGDIEHYKLKPSPTTLFVARLNPITSEESLEVIFARFGPVKKVKIFKGEKSIYAFIDYQDKESVEAAYVSLHESCYIDGYKVIVDFSQSTKHRD